jgi:hypothetical protein
MRERHNVRIDPGDTDVEGAVLPDHEIEVDGQGRSGRCSTTAGDAPSTTRKRCATSAGDEVEWLVFIAR